MTSEQGEAADPASHEALWREIRALTQGMAGFERVATKILQLEAGLKGLQEQNAALRAVNATLQSELDGMRASDAEEMLSLAHRVTALETLTCDLAEQAGPDSEEMTLSTVSPFTAEDIELIKAHVRHPGALEAAKLKERLRSVHALLYNAGWIEGTTPAEEHAPALCAMIAGILRDAP